ncbi:MAG: hypothetical protein HYZ75_17880 [Elusimicrobia bacterium]|nr:hypothetical protein [Elusimicrobiota bacterium]
MISDMPRIPLRSLLLTLAVCILSHLSFSAQALSLFVLVIAVPVMAMLLLIYGIHLLRKTTPERILKFKTTVIQALLVAVSLAGTLHGQRHLYRKVETTMQPLIDAAEAFHAKTGKYPDDSDRLVPQHLAEIPACPVNGRLPHYMKKQPNSFIPFPGPAVGDDGFIVTCYTMMFWKYTYDSQTHKWFGWD